MLAENVNRAGFKKESLVFRTIARESTLRPNSDGAARRVSERIESCFHPQSEFLSHDLRARPSPVQDESGPHGKQVGRQQSFEMPFTWSSKSRRQLPTQRSATPFCHGQPKAVRVGSLPMSLTAEPTSASNFASRSDSKNLCVCW
jgi:hypothetical protein